VVFFLLCENAGNMLETVRSRAPSLRLSPVDDEQLRAHLAAQQSAFAQMSAAEQDELLRMAQGSVGQALRLLDGRARKPMVERRRFVSQLIQVCFTSQADALQKTECIKGFGSVREEVLNRLTLLQQAMRDLILLKRCETATLVFYSDREAALRIATACATVRLISFYEQVELARTRILRNANIRLALTALLLAESTAAVKSV
jgi:DNA polymerase-3 subunit delta'